MLTTTSSNIPATPYRGRFAPSPTGPLHLGSLLTALGSYLRARSLNGEWLLRMDNIDPPREDPSAAARIPEQLEQHGLHWDGEIFYQSTQITEYNKRLQQLIDQELAYYCTCSRQRLRDIGGTYDRHCVNNRPEETHDAAVRFKFDHGFHWEDAVQGTQDMHPEALLGDFVIHRRDKLPSYQLAAAVDDMNQQITEVARGADLIESTARQGALICAMGGTPPAYAHLPLLCSADGNKLSKQFHAPPLEARCAKDNLYHCLTWLNQRPPSTLQQSSIPDILSWAIENWSMQSVPNTISSAALC